MGLSKAYEKLIAADGQSIDIGSDLRFTDSARLVASTGQRALDIRDDHTLLFTYDRAGGNPGLRVWDDDAGQTALNIYSSEDNGNPIDDALFEYNCVFSLAQLNSDPTTKEGEEIPTGAMWYRSDL